MPDIVMCILKLLLLYFENNKYCSLNKMTFSRMMKYLCLHYWHMLKYGVCNHVMYTKQRVNLNFNMCFNICLGLNKMRDMYSMLHHSSSSLGSKEKLLDTSSSFNEWGFKSHILRWIINNIVPYPYCRQKVI